MSHVLTCHNLEKTSLYSHETHGKFEECPNTKAFHFSQGRALPGYLTTHSSNSFIKILSNSSSPSTCVSLTSMRGIFFPIFGITILFS